MAKEKPVIMFNIFDVFYPHLGDSFCRKKAFELAIKEMPIEQIIDAWKGYEKICSSDGSYQLIIGGMYLNKGDYNEVINILEKATQYAKYDTRYHKLFLHSAYIGCGKESKAIDLAKEMIEDFPNWYGGYLALGINFYNAKDWNNAYKYLQKALTLNDQKAQTYQFLAAVAYELRKDDKVHLYYNKAFSIDPFNTLLNRCSSFAMVGIYIYEKNFKEAKNIMDYQLEDDPTIKNDHRFIKLQKYYENELKASEHSN
ncbi:MAG: hypothetical protein ABSA84_02120 [Gammaproteobacteria bacterium]